MTGSVRVTRGVWRPESAVQDLAGRAAALLSVLPEGTVVGGLTAAELHGFWLPDRPSNRLEFIARRDAADPEAHSGSRRAEVRLRRQHLDPRDTAVREGLPVSSAERTWVDIAAQLTTADLVAAGDSALRGDATLERLTEATARARHCRGVRRARAALPLLDRRSRSRPESHLRYAIVSAGLPAPEVNKPVYSSYGEWLSEPDLSYEDVRLALEYNGADHAEVRRMRRDMTREIDVHRRGRWQTVAFGPAEVFGRPDLVASYVRELRRECAKLL
jgi:hypothetical protein